MAAITTAVATTAFAGQKLMESFQPDIPDLPDPPSVDDPAIQQRRKDEKRRLMARQGFRDTIKTSPLGVQEDSSQRKTLLGQ